MFNNSEISRFNFDLDRQIIRFNNDNYMKIK